MSIVVDANIIVALVISLPYSDQVARKMAGWQAQNATLIAPILLEYEMISALRKLTLTGTLTTEEAIEAAESFLVLRVKTLVPTVALHQAALRWAGRLQQSVAYDAQYLALAEQLNAPFWTADRRLVNGAQQVGVTWVHWIGEVDS